MSLRKNLLNSRPSVSVKIEEAKEAMAKALEDEAISKEVSKFQEELPESDSEQVEDGTAIQKNSRKKRPIPEEFKGDLSLSKSLTVRTSAQMKGALELLVRLLKDKDSRSRQNDIINIAIKKHLIKELGELGYDVTELNSM